MSDEIEYIEPTQEHVGQMVEVRQRGMSEYRQRTLVAVLTNEMKYRFICKDNHSPDIAGHWGEARIARPLTYAERQARCGLKVGDRVKFARKFETGEGGYKLPWLTDLNRFIGHIGHITRLEGAEDGRGGCVCIEGIVYVLPYFALEKVEDRVATRDDIGKQVYINGAFGDVFTIDVIFGVEGDLWRAVIRSGDNRLIYELSNLRVKE